MVAEALARAGDVDRAEAVAVPSPTRPSRRRRWRGMAGVLAETGDVDRVVSGRPAGRGRRPRPGRDGRWRLWRRHWPRRVMWTGPRPSPVPSPTRPGRRRRWPVWRGHWPAGAGPHVGHRAEAIARSITDPSGRQRRWPMWRGHWPSPVMSTGASGRPAGRGRRPFHHRPVRAGMGAGGVWRRHWPGAGDVDRAEAVARPSPTRTRQA